MKVGVNDGNKSEKSSVKLCEGAFKGFEDSFFVEELSTRNEFMSATR